MRCKITVRMDNAAFGDYPGNELSRILFQLARDLEQQEVDVAELAREEIPLQLRDINGNRVGNMEVDA